MKKRKPNNALMHKYIKAEILDEIRAEIEKLRKHSCSCADGVIDDIEDIIDKYRIESEV